MASVCWVQKNNYIIISIFKRKIDLHTKTTSITLYYYRPIAASAACAPSLCDTYSALAVSALCTHHLSALYVPLVCKAHTWP